MIIEPHKITDDGGLRASICRNGKPFRSAERGFSLIELMIVIAVMAILAGVGYMSFSAPTKYAPDDQSLKILDVLQEARQKALTQHRVMRVEINNTKKFIRLINEADTKAMNATTGKNLVNDSDDDKEVRSIPFDVKNLVIGTKPGNVTTTVPTATTYIPEMSYDSTTYALSNGNSVFTLCFVKDGRVLSPGANGLCEPNTDEPGGATVYVSEKPDGSGNSKIIRALTISAVSGAAGIVKCQLDTTGKCVKWVK